MAAVATERVKSGRPDDTKLPVPGFGIEGLSKWPKESSICHFDAQDKVRECRVASGLFLPYLGRETRVSFDGVERRRHPRYVHSDNIEFRFDLSGIGTTLHGISVDSSDSGLSLYTFAPIYAGQNIAVRTTLPVPYRKATVTWVQQRSEDLYRAGLKFINVIIEPVTAGEE
jgi:hypothetical protein